MRLRQATVTRALAAVVLLSLLLPWLSGSDDGQPLTVLGGDAELWFTLAMVVLALNVLLLAELGIAAGVLGSAMLALTTLLLRRGDAYSAPDPAWGAYVALAAEAGLVAIGVLSAIAAHRRRGRAAGSASGAGRRRGGPAG
jgi:hypothetical protein